MSPRRLATVLKQLRDDAKMTQEELGKRAKVARSYVALIDAAVLDVRGPLAGLGGRLAPDSAPKSDRLMVTSADPQAKPQTLPTPPRD